MNDQQQAAYEWEKLKAETARNIADAELYAVLGQIEMEVAQAKANYIIRLSELERKKAHALRQHGEDVHGEVFIFRVIRSQVSGRVPDDDPLLAIFKHRGYPDNRQ
jgi:hypothetical protein